MPQRFHFTFRQGLWHCQDKLTQFSGQGASVIRADWDCQRELEMATSDLHK